jgi:hypothetical protein
MVASLHKKVTHGGSSARYARERKQDDKTPADVRAFMAGGPVKHREEAAAQEAIRFERKYCLSELERMRSELPANASLTAQVFLETEIAYLRRVMHIPPTPERIREQTRERVRRYRERQRSGADG